MQALAAAPQATACRRVSRRASVVVTASIKSVRRDAVAGEKYGARRFSGRRPKQRRQRNRRALRPKHLGQGGQEAHLHALRRSRLARSHCTLRRYRETFQISLLGLPGAPATEQVLVAGPGTVLVPFVIQRPLGIVFEERRLALNAAPACVVDEVAPGRCAAVPAPLLVRL